MRHAPPSGPRTLVRALTAALFVATIGFSMPLVAPAAQAGTNPPPPTASCSTVVSSKSALISQVNSAANGSVVCVANGDYGSLTLGANRSGWVTVRSQNPQGAAFDRITFDDASYIRVEQVLVDGRVGNSQDSSHHIQIAGSVVGSVWAEAPALQFAGPGPAHWVIEYNDIRDCEDFCVALVSESPSRYWPVSNITVRGNKMGPMAGGEDAIRIHNWRNLVFENNEIFGVIEDGQHNDCLQSVWGGKGIVFSGNYLHDNNCQTFFLKDGYTEDIVFENNLSVRNRAGNAPVVAQIWPSRNVTVRNNTIWDDSAFYVRNGTYSSMFTSGPMTGVEVSNNVMENFLPYDDNQPSHNRAGIFKNPSVMHEDYNVFGGGWSWVPSHMGSHSVHDTTPNFVRISSNRNQDLSYGDWRLSSSVTQGGATYHAGITWKLAGRTFGIEAYGLPPFDPGTNPPPPNEPPVVVPDHVKRLAGSDRYATAGAVSKATFGNASIVFVAAGSDFPDALAAAAAGGHKGAPVLLVGNSVPSATVAELQRLEPDTIYVVGGTRAISSSVANQLDSYGTVKRLAGDDRYETAAAISKAMFGSASKVFIADGENFPDALAAAAAGGHKGAPVLLVNDTIPSSTAKELARLNPQTIYVVGGTAAVSNALASQLGAYGTVKRLSGGDRYATGAAVSKAFFSGSSNVYLASGSNFPDALAAAAAGGHKGGPVLLVGSSMPGSTASEVDRLNPDVIYVVGGKSAIPDKVVAGL